MRFASFSVKHTVHLPLLLLFLTLLLLTMGCVTQSVPTLEEEAQAIDKGLMCPVCPAETIDQSQVPIAKQMRAIVREKLAAGESREQILAFFVERYGENILAAPQKQGFSLVAWVIPGLGVLVGLAAVGVAVRMMQRRQGTEVPTAVMPAPVAESGGDDLAPYLAMVDEDLGQLLGKGYAPPKGT